MSKVIWFVGIFFILFLGVTVGYHVVSANEMIKEESDILDVQSREDKFFSSYEYTVDNPNIILNPYNISPLTALILFDTEREVSVSLTVKGKSDDTTFHNTFSKNKKHFIPVYGLYPAYENKVIISYEDVTKEITIKTDKLPNDFVSDKYDGIFDKNLVFIQGKKYPYAIDKEGEVRWFFTRSFTGNMKRLNNGHLMLGNDILLNNGYSKNIMEMDLLGKIYYQHDIENGYYGDYVEVNSSLFVLSNDLLEIDKQSGIVLNKIKLKKSYYSIAYDEEKNLFILFGDDKLVLSNESFDIIEESDFLYHDNVGILSNLYFNDNEYKVVNGVKFSNYRKTPESNERFWLIGYKKIDEEYLKYKINFMKDVDYFSVTGNFSSSDEVYVILDKFLDKKIYYMVGNQLFINSVGIHGKYSIYLRINGTIYHTNQYITFA